MVNPHDLIWIDDPQALFATDPLPAWVMRQWQPEQPLVVRRAENRAGGVPVGVRGMKRSQRSAAWVVPAAIQRIVTPESLVTNSSALLHSPFISLAPIQALLQLVQQRWPLIWGVTGSCGFALATALPVIHAASDLDLLIRCPTPALSNRLAALQHRLCSSLCRIDVQVTTPQGGFSLEEWLRGGQVLLKTAQGPRLTHDPWAEELQ
ncbi:malonate decarboxylase holo-ACP synthase [Enterobacteriaceae bacterium LUAb1]